MEVRIIVFCKLLVYIGCFLFGNHALAWSFFDSKLQWYSCADSNTARICSSGCKPGAKVEYKVNTASNTIFENVYHGDNLSHTAVLENCLVADATNWICETHFRLPRGGWHDSITQMTNGVVYSYLGTFFSNRKDANKQSFSCAK